MSDNTKKIVSIICTVLVVVCVLGLFVVGSSANVDVAVKIGTAFAGIVSALVNVFVSGKD